MHSYNSIIHAKQSLLLFVNLANYYIFDSFYTIEMIKNEMGHIIDNFFGDGRCRRDPRVDRFLTSGLTLTGRGELTSEQSEDSVNWVRVRVRVRVTG